MGLPLLRGLAAVIVLLATNIESTALAAQDDDWESQESWEELDGKPKAGKGAVRAMALGPHTLPAGRFSAATSAGLLYWNVKLKAGVTDWFDVTADMFQPYEGFGKVWVVGGGPKFRLFTTGRVAYAFNLKLFGQIYSNAPQAVSSLPKGFLVWPSFQIGMTTKHGCFYGEIGVLLYPYVSSDSTQDYTFGGAPAHFGGEIYITDWFHIFINVDIVFSAHFGIYSLDLTGPYNMFEGGVVFII